MRPWSFRVLPALASLLAFGAPVLVHARDHIPANVSRPEATTIAYESRVSNANSLGVTITNFGFVGNNFINRSPSFEYPLGAGFEHMGHGALWVGARALDGQGSFLGVTTGAVDIASGSIAAAATEFTPAGNSLLLRSSLPNSQYYDPAAVSELDLIGLYDDRTPKSTTSNPEVHRPLGIVVRQETYAWSFADYRDALFFHFVITNTGPPLTDVWVGFYAELASGSKNAYSCWPPTAPCGGTLGSWYSKKWIQYDDNVRLLREHYCRAQPIPSACNLSSTPYWVGIKLLTPPDQTSGQGVTLAAWSYAPGDPARDQDVERYSIMSAGTLKDLTQPALMPQTGDPAELLAIGPFTSIEPGDSIAVDFALVGGGEIADIQAHARAAQDLYDMGYQFAPTGTTLALVRSSASPDRVELTWQASGSAAKVVTVERRDSRTNWEPIGEVTADAFGLMRFEDRAVVPGNRYGYRLGLGQEPRIQHLGEAWVDVPKRSSFALRGLEPNPSRPGEALIALSLEESEGATVELFDLAGRRVMRQDLVGIGPGDHRVRLDGAFLTAGVYIVRLTQRAHSAEVKAIVTR